MWRSSTNAAIDPITRIAHARAPHEIRIGLGGTHGLAVERADEVAALIERHWAQRVGGARAPEAWREVQRESFERPKRVFRETPQPRSMGAFIGQYAQAGQFVDGAGLGGSKTRTRLVFRGGRCAQKQGPYQGEHELPAATLLLKVGTREEAIGWAERYGKILGDCELELGKLNEPWDIGLMPAPENPPLQMLLIEKADQASEAGARATKQRAR